jgi:hypothetical protein
MLMKYVKKIVSLKLSHLNILNYKYNEKEAMEELGLDSELVHQLVEDYVIQIIKATLQFEKYLEELKRIEREKNAADYTAFRDLAHKNLGVARNLRIKDAEKLLYEMMLKNDLEYLGDCIEALKACSIKLKPECAYKTLKLIEVKSSL